MDDDERKLWIEAGVKLAEHNLDVWKKYGPAAQQVIIGEMEKLSGEEIAGVRPLLVSMLAHVLSTELGGTTWRSDSVMIHQGRRATLGRAAALARRGDCMARTLAR